MAAEKNRRVLVIDDNRAIHDDFRKILSPVNTTASALATTEAELFGSPANAGGMIQFEVDSAYQGEEGLLLVEQAISAGRPYAVAFVDVRMPPGLDGVETSRRMWELDRDLQVVLCTAYSDYSWDAMFEMLGYRDGLVILKKPFDTVEALQLAHALTEKWWLHRQAQRKLKELEGMVAERTEELQQINHVLQTEVVEHRRAERMLRESEERFRSYFELGLIGMAITSPSKGLIEVNDHFCLMLGYERSELLQSSWADLTHPADLAADAANFNRIIAGEIDGYSMDKRFIHKDGRLIDTTISVKCVRRVNRSVDYLLGIVQDITERKRLEAQLFQSQKMETVGKLAGGVAHEFNSIMTAIIGQSELLLNELPSGNPLRQNAQEVRKAADRAATLTRQLLAYGRKQFLQPESLDLNGVLTGMEDMLRHLMGIDVEVRIVGAPDLKMIRADAGQIEQVIVNIANNARDAMPSGGKLILETSNISVDSQSAGRDPDLKPGNYVMLVIMDTGAGMSAAVKTSVFEPFFTTKGVGQGAGLGLSMCYGIIKQSGGHISLDSELGRGATFKIYLPQVESRIMIEPLDLPALPRGTETIMLVEDDPAMREMAATLLRRLGYTVLAAADGIEALSLKRQRDTGQIDLLITDAVMPHKGGKALSDRLRVLYPRARILFTSAYTENAVVSQGALNEGVALLQKPFTPSALAHKLREVLDADPFIEPNDPVTGAGGAVPSPPATASSDGFR